MTKQTIILLGGSGGVGSSFCATSPLQQAEVFATYFSSPPPQPVDGVTYIHVDMRDATAIRAMIKQVHDTTGRIDVVVNVLSPQLHMQHFDTVPLKQFFDDIAVGFTSAVYCYHEVIPYMKQQASGLLLTFLSSSIRNPVPSRMSSYVTVKAALKGLSDSLRVELERYGIWAATITPGYIQTALLDSFPDKLLAQLIATGTCIQPADIASLVWAIITHPQAAKQQADFFVPDAAAVKEVYHQVLSI